ncbi:hypothetical protein [Candidatus Nitrosopumilus sediminis]|uniref:Uncharacterized protein n=1 Tax=Candidatus Nitrosopumilus sediminis TaxID=1229909 RepID=K0BDI5_9ARCH|nr:hypothetical protein [Candidatus Nitrosopumilus sediminis]AFS82381.1 hypothetical protein NSED_02875 [Candidatus Nitrosopumilus sediminis]
MKHIEHDKTAQNYDNLQAAYKKLLEEYEEIKNKDAHSPKLEEKIKEMSKKQKEIQDLASELT